LNFLLVVIDPPFHPSKTLCFSLLLEGAHARPAHLIDVFDLFQRILAQSAQAGLRADQ
jgi:hypothetical protein